MAGCRHPDIQRFGDIRCCLSCGEAVFDEATEEPRVTSVQSSSKYQYRPLRHNLGHEIRLIVLFAGEPSDDLVCDITTVNLADRPSYEAVSYTWADTRGDISSTSEIHCGRTIIAVTKNCEAALRRLRLRHRKRRLWVDAVCINQNDTEEKNHQVRLMSTIYSDAVQVLSYLGVSSWQAHKLRSVVGFLHDNAQLPAHEPTRKEVMACFLELPYFDRVWIIQEIGLAQLVTLVIGEHEVRWTGDTSSKLLNECSMLGLKPPSVLRWTPSSRPKEEDDILAVLCKSRNCSASDPRDKVFALLGLTNLRFSAQFPVDYSLTYLDVFVKFATYCVEELGRFDILQHCQHVSRPEWQNIRRIPTWVPQWDFKDAYDPLPVQFSAVEKQAFASSWHTALASPSAWLCEEQLQTKQILGGISSDSNFYSSETNISTTTCRDQVHTWSELQSAYKPDWSQSLDDDEHLAPQVVLQQSADFTYKVTDRAAWPHIDGSQPVHAASSTLPCLKVRAHRLDSIVRRLGPIAKHRVTAIPYGDWSAFGVSNCNVCTTPEKTPAFTDPGFYASSKQERKRLIAKMEALGAGKTAFATKHSVGFTNGILQIGDSVWALYGADVPFVLRKVDGHYELVGDCYLHRAGRPFPCRHCGADAAPWPMETDIIDIW